MDGNSKGIIQLGLKKKINKKTPLKKRGVFFNTQNIVLILHLADALT